MFPRFSYHAAALAAAALVVATKAFAQVVEPASNPAVVTFTNVKTYAYGVTFNACNADGYLVLRKENAATTAQPADGTVYHAGDVVGDAIVVYAGPDTFCTLGGAMATKAFYTSVFAYNGSGSSIDYKQSNAVAVLLTLPATMKADYYDALDPTDSNFVIQLKDRVRNPYTQNAYNDYDETMVAEFASSDAPGGQRFLTCVYSGQQYAYTPPFAWTPATPFSREHTWCFSWMPTYPSQSAEPYSDYHHLFPVNQNQANGPRSNHPLGIVQTVISSFMDGKLGYDASGHTVYEPRDAQKGDAARALLYMALRYDGVGGQSWTFNRINDTILPAIGEAPENPNLLLQWNAQDPPDAYEVSRNDYVQHLQHNRNPFVDHPEYADLIDFNTLRYKQTTGAKVATTKAFAAHAFPVPSTGAVTVETNCDGGELLLRWYDAMGNNVKTVRTADCRVAQTDASELPAGLYVLLVSRNGAQQATRWLKE